jgi:hypothetical protein
MMAIGVPPSCNHMCKTTMSMVYDELTFARLLYRVLLYFLLIRRGRDEE